jgi:hypothetical protein
MCVKSHLTTVMYGFYSFNLTAVQKKCKQENDPLHAQLSMREVGHFLTYLYVYYIVSLGGWLISTFLN